jgi:hypothetical protein
LYIRYLLLLVPFHPIPLELWVLDFSEIPGLPCRTFHTSIFR